MIEEKSNVEKASQWFRNSITVRLLGMGVILLLLLIPMSMVENLIYDRIHLHNSVKHEIAESWGMSQALGGPILTVPCETVYEYVDPITKEKKENRQRFTSHFLPEDLQISGEMIPENRHRGIYNVTVYESHLKLKGDFNFP